MILSGINLQKIYLKNSKAHCMERRDGRNVARCWEQLRTCLWTNMMRSDSRWESSATNNRVALSSWNFQTLKMAMALELWDVSRPLVKEQLNRLLFFVNLLIGLLPETWSKMPESLKLLAMMKKRKFPKKGRRSCLLLRKRKGWWEMILCLERENVSLYFFIYYIS